MVVQTIACPNGCGMTLQVFDNGNKQCTKCGYSFAAKKVVAKPSSSSEEKGERYTPPAVQEVNQIMKGLLMELQFGEPVPWRAAHIIVDLCNAVSGRKYNKINRWLLSYTSETQFTTSKAAVKAGFAIPSEARPFPVFEWVPPYLTKDEKAKLSPVEQETLLAKRPFRSRVELVYRVKDIPNMPRKKGVDNNHNEKIGKIEEFIASIPGLKLEVGGNKPCYCKESDVVCIPRIEQYESADAYYFDLAHEIAHWTGHKSRLNRDQKRFDQSIDYGKEELVAEMGAAYICHTFGIQVPMNSASYIDGWMKAIDADSWLLASAASAAEKVLEFLSLSGKKFG